MINTYAVGLINESTAYALFLFLNTGMTMEEVSVRMDVSTEDLEKFLNS